MTVAIRRGFADLSHGQVHYRFAGHGSLAPGIDAVVLIHASPTSSRQMQRMIADLAPLCRVIAPDTPGNGDSDPLIAEVSIASHALAFLALLDALELRRVAVYGAHTGAAIAAELAILAPERVGAVALDGFADLDSRDFHGAGRDEVLASYAPVFEPDLDGAMLQRLFQFCRDQFLFFPWYARNRDARRDGGLPGAADLYGWVSEVLKAHATYHHNYHAAFRWDARARLPLIACPALVLAAQNDPLANGTAAIARDSGIAFAGLPRFDAADYSTSRKALLERLWGASPSVG
jgi:pimeloyl-ACP methyl ester carboxylesterase